VFSQAVGPLLAAGLLAMDGIGGLEGWQYLFLIEGLLAVVLSFGWCARPAPCSGRPDPHRSCGICLGAATRRAPRASPRMLTHAPH
jgi:MFS family permease